MASASRAAGFAAGVSGTILAAMAARYAWQRSRVERPWLPVVERKLSDIGEVDELSVLPLVERLAPSTDLVGEPGVSYLLRAGQTTLLFDVGLNSRRGAPSTVAHNAATLRADLGKLDAVVISHLHLDHVGGLGAMRRGTFVLPDQAVQTRGVPAYVPTDMTHPHAEIRLVTGPLVIAPGVAVLPPLPRVLFWPGPVAEQALVVNVRDFGLVMISGCGHPGVERMLAVAELVMDVPIRAVVGGLHLPVHAFGTALAPQAVLGNPGWPWRPIGERDVMAALECIGALGPRLVALSSHDSTPWTYDAFQEAFADRYRTLRVGEELKIP